MAGQELGFQILTVPNTSVDGSIEIGSGTGSRAEYSQPRALPVLDQAGTYSCSLVVSPTPHLGSGTQISPEPFHARIHFDYQVQETVLAWT